MGRVLSGGGRPAWYDRNPVSKSDGHQGEYAPHAATTRISYTCPANKKAMVEVMQVTLKRLTAATTAALAYALALYTPSGGSGKNILMASLTSVENAAKDRSEAAIGGNTMLKAGDRIQFDTCDLSTGGTIQYILNYKLTEFDA